MRQALRTVRPLSYCYAHLRSVVRLQRCRIEQSKPLYALAQTQARPVIRSACCGLHPPLHCARTSAFGSIVGAGSVDHMQTNRLASEESPYLLQHQHNPVRSAVLKCFNAVVSLMMLFTNCMPDPTSAVLYCRLTGTLGAKMPSRRLWQRISPYFFLWVTLHVIGRTVQFCSNLQQHFCVL